MPYDRDARTVNVTHVSCFGCPSAEITEHPKKTTGGPVSPPRIIVFVVNARAADKHVPAHRRWGHFLVSVAKGRSVALAGNSIGVFDQAINNKLLLHLLTLCN